MLKVLLIVPYLDRNDVGEPFLGYQWASHISHRCQTTVLTQYRRGAELPSTQLPGAKVIEWQMREPPRRFERINAMAKPSLVFFRYRVRRWMSRVLQNGSEFDLVHQIMPNGMRFLPVVKQSSLPSVLGPIAGSLRTPDLLRKECRRESWYSKLRALDRARFRFGLRYRRSISGQDLLLVVGEYVIANLPKLHAPRTRVVTELGVDRVVGRRNDIGMSNVLRLLHVGRFVRTKGQRDLIRALALLRDRPWIQASFVGAGEDLRACQIEARRLCVAHRVRFLGRLQHEDVLHEYTKADLFVFPSFREPSGSVLYEAMAAGLPVVAVDYGGPPSNVPTTAGILVSVGAAASFAGEIAQVIVRLDSDRAKLRELSDGAISHMRQHGLWERKVDRLIDEYNSMLGLLT